MNVNDNLKKIFDMESFESNTNNNIKQGQPSKIDSSMTLDIPEHIIAAAKDPAWRNEQRRLRKEEETMEYGYKIDDRKPNMTGRGMIFTPDVSYMKAKQARSRNKVNDVEIHDHYRDLLSDESIRAKVPAFTPKMVKGLQKSLNSLVNDQEFLKKAEDRQFMNWLNDNKIDAGKLNDKQESQLREEFVKSKRLRIDTLLNELIKQAYGVFRYLSEEKENEHNTIPLETRAAIYTDKTKLRQMIKDYIDNNGPFIKKSEFSMIRYFFNKYGHDNRDAVYFKSGALDMYNRPMERLFNEFTDVTGYDFTELYALYHEEWRLISLAENGNEMDDVVTEEEFEKKKSGFSEDDIEEMEEIIEEF